MLPFFQSSLTHDKQTFFQLVWPVFYRCHIWFHRWCKCKEPWRLDFCVFPVGKCFLFVFSQRFLWKFVNIHISRVSYIQFPINSRANTQILIFTFLATKQPPKLRNRFSVAKVNVLENAVLTFQFSNWSNLNKLVKWKISNVISKCKRCNVESVDEDAPQKSHRTTTNNHFWPNVFSGMYDFDWSLKSKAPTIIS